jgi:flagellar biogenesis protein FliO
MQQNVTIAVIIIILFIIITALAYGIHRLIHSAGGQGSSSSGSDSLVDDD